MSPLRERCVLPRFAAVHRQAGGGRGRSIPLLCTWISPTQLPPHVPLIFPNQILFGLVFGPSALASWLAVIPSRKAAGAVPEEVGRLRL